MNELSVIIMQQIVEYGNYLSHPFYTHTPRYTVYSSSYKVQQIIVNGIFAARRCCFAFEG